jgi:hypothetical protein
LGLREAEVEVKIEAEDFLISLLSVANITVYISNIKAIFACSIIINGKGIPIIRFLAKS